jgi:hypothetical protein
MKAALTRPGRTVLYISKTRAHAKQIMWEPLKQLGRFLRLPLQEKQLELRMVVPGGGDIWLGGAETTRHADIYRGDGYAGAAVDEAGHVKVLEYLVKEVIDPALSDLEAPLLLTGTPGLVPQGLFFDASTGSTPGWQISPQWTLRDNPIYAGRAERVLQEVLQSNGWTVDHPTYRREWEGRWSISQDKLVYRTPKVVDRKLGASRVVIGFDIGASESAPTTAFAVLEVGRSKVQVVRAYKKAIIGVHQLAEELKELQTAYRPSDIVGDPGALGAGYLWDLRKQYNLPVFAAQKGEKLSYIEQMNGDSISGVLEVYHEGTQALLDEMRSHGWRDSARSAESKQTPNHCCDATLYGWRKARSYLRFDEPIDQTQEQLIEQMMDEQPEEGWEAYE